MTFFGNKIVSWLSTQGIFAGTFYLLLSTLINSQIITCGAYYLVFGYLPVQTIFITPVITLIIAAPVAVIVVQLIRDLVDSEVKYVMAVEAMHGLLWEWNPKSEKLRTYPGRFDTHELESFSADGSGHRFSLLVHPEDRDKYLNAFKSYLRGDTPHYECEYRIRNRRGGYSWVSDRAIGKKDADGRFCKVVGAVQMIDRTRETETDLRQAADPQSLTYRKRRHTPRCSSLWSRHAARPLTDEARIRVERDLVIF